MYLHLTAQVPLIKYSGVSLDTIHKDSSHFRKGMDLLYSKLTQTLTFCKIFWFACFTEVERMNILHVVLHVLW